MIKSTFLLHYMYYFINFAKGIYTGCLNILILLFWPTLQTGSPIDSGIWTFSSSSWMSAWPYTAEFPSLPLIRQI